MFLSLAFKFCTSVELKLSLRTRLALQTHARRMGNRREVYCQSSPPALLTSSPNPEYFSKAFAGD
jgi:hypothetical protein